MSSSPSPSRPPSALLYASPSRLIIPTTANPTPALSNMRLRGTSTVPESSASSVINLDMSEGILIQDAEAEADTADSDEGIAIGQVDTTARDEESKKVLRDQLRKTLNTRPAGEQIMSKRRKKSTSELVYSPTAKYAPREYFVLTDAGKPVFTSRAETDSESFTTTIGIIQALISVFIDDHDKLKCINAGNTRITFLQRSPLYYVCASSWGEPESVTRSHLEFMHLQILSIITASQLQRIFERRTNFDLRRLLEGAETFIHTMLQRLEFDLAMATSSLHCLKLDASTRKRVADALVPTKMKDILYVILISQGRVVTLIRPKKHSIHPGDIHILLNTVHNPSVFNSPASSSWIPICLPKFNPSGFLNLYVSFIQREERSSFDGSIISAASSDAMDSTALLCVSANAEFDTIRGWCDAAKQKMVSDGSLKALMDAVESADYTVAELGIPGLRHFVYKARAQVQVTFPVFEDPYDGVAEQRRLVTLYQILHDAIHAKSGQSEPLKLQYLRTEKECVMGWITQSFEMYVALSPRLPKSAVVGAANAVSRWIKKEESRLFLKDAPVF